MNVNPKTLKLIEERLPLLHRLLDEARIEELLDEARNILAIDPEDLNACHIASRYLIDGGTAAQNTEAVLQGMDILKRMISEPELPDEGYRVLLKYNLSNVFAYLYEHYRTANQNELAENNLQAQKEQLQELLLLREHIPAELLPAILTNYANLLDHFNRTFEAVDHFLDCLKVDPNHGVARGNCGEALRRTRFWSKQHWLRNLQASWDFLSRAVSEPQSITAWAGPSAIVDLANKRERLRQEIYKLLEYGPKTLEEFRQHREAEHSKPEPKPWLQEIFADRLLLTFNQVPLNSKDEAKDDAFFDSISGGFSDEDEARVVDLTNILNTIKEDFTSARYLYYHARDEQPRLTKRNSITDYGDLEGAAEFGLISGLLKTSFRLSVDLLDKVAAFLVLYFELGLPEQGYNFNNFWFIKRDPRAGVIHPTLATKLTYNYPLRGLRDLQRDFHRQEYPGPLKDLRNAAVHRWLPLYWLPIEKSRGPALKLDHFYSLTLFLLRQAKAAALMLIATVNVEEAQRHGHRADSKPVALTSPLILRPPRSR